MASPEQSSARSEHTPVLLCESVEGSIFDLGDGNIGIIGKDCTAELDPEIAQVPGSGRGPDERIVVIGRSALDEAFGPNSRLDQADDAPQEQL